MRTLLASLALAVALPVAAQSPAFAIDANTLALYTFDGTDPDTTFDLSGNALHALHDGTTSVPGRHGNARQFDGVDDRVDMDAVRLALQGADAWTLEYIAAATTDPWIPELLAHPCSNGWRLYAGGTSARFAVKTTTSGGFCSWGSDQTLTIPNIGTDWHYFALAFGENALRFYVDGHLMGSLPASGVFQGAGGGQRAWVGFDDFGTGFHYSGLADELRVSDVARSADEICATADALGWACTATANEPDGAAGLASALHAAAPNPFHERTAIPYDVAEAGPVRVALYNALGREVAVLVDGVQLAGRHEVTLDGADLAAGVYLVRMAAVGFSSARRLTRLR